MNGQGEEKIRRRTNSSSSRLSFPFHRFQNIIYTLKFYLNDDSIKSIYEKKLLICKLKKDEEINLCH